MVLVFGKLLPARLKANLTYGVASYPILLVGSEINTRS
jgi:hypothetical protein